VSHRLFGATGAPRGFLVGPHTPPAFPLPDTPTKMLARRHRAGVPPRDPRRPGYHPIIILRRTVARTSRSCRVPGSTVAPVVTRRSSRVTRPPRTG
jgi:hypothetical protein